MFKQLVVLSSLLAGTGAAGVAMYLQANPLPFSKREHVNLNTYLYSARTLPAVQSDATPRAAFERDEPRVYELPLVIVTPAKPAPALAAPTRAKPAEPAGATPRPAPRELRPCSKFREVGPMHVDDGVPSGVRGVRDLC